MLAECEGPVNRKIRSALHIMPSIRVCTAETQGPWRSTTLQHKAMLVCPSSSQSSPQQRADWYGTCLHVRRRGATVAIMHICSRLSFHSETIPLPPCLVHELYRDTRQSSMLMKTACAEWSSCRVSSISWKPFWRLAWVVASSSLRPPAARSLAGARYTLVMRRLPCTHRLLMERPSCWRTLLSCTTGAAAQRATSDVQPVRA